MSASENESESANDACGRCDPGNANGRRHGTAKHAEKPIDDVVPVNENVPVALANGTACAPVNENVSAAQADGTAYEKATAPLANDHCGSGAHEPPGNQSVTAVGQSRRPRP